MLELYRGLIDILIFQSRVMDEKTIFHIRGFNNGQTDSNNFGVSGFWNLLLEIAFIMFNKIIVAFGIVLTVVLAIIFFPLHALCVAMLNILNHRAEVVDPTFIEPIVDKK